MFRASYLLVVAGGAAASLYGESNLNHSCSLAPTLLSCSPPTLVANVSRVLDTCCTETFGGLFLATQFWDTYTGLESQGQKLPRDTWTIHGLWPDFCNGSYTQYCDLSRQFDPVPSPNTTNGLQNGTIVPAYKGPTVGTFLTTLGKLDLIDYMNRYWINQGAPNTDLWAHEFSKHATCFSTFDTPCYGPQYVQHQEVVEYFETTVKYYKRLPTWGWLAQAGIRPSNTTSYSIADIQAALTKGYGLLPYLGCSGPAYNTTDAGKGSMDAGKIYLTEAWYYFYAYGRPQDGAWVPQNASVSGSAVTSCATSKSAVRYLERTARSLQ